MMLLGQMTMQVLLEKVITYVSLLLLERACMFLQTRIDYIISIN